MIFPKSANRNFLKLRPQSKSLNWLTKWYPNREIHIWIESLQSKDSREIDIIKFHLVYYE